MSLIPKCLQLPFQFLEVYLLILKFLSNLWKCMLTNIFKLKLLHEFLTLECISYESRIASKCLKEFVLLNQPAKQEPKFQLIGSQLQQCKKSTELTSNILKNGIIFVSVYTMKNNLEPFLELAIDHKHISLQNKQMYISRMCVRCLPSMVRKN